MRKFFSFVLMSMFIFLVVACSLFLHSDDPKPNDKNQNNQNNKTLIAEILEKSIHTMSQWKGFDLTYIGSQDINLINQPTRQSANGHLTINNRVQYLHANLFHLNINIQSVLQENGREENGELIEDIYVEGNMMYYKEQDSKQWKQTQVSQKSIFQVLGNNPRYFQPIYFLEKMKQQKSKLRIEENDSDYIISVSLSNNNEIKEMMDSVMDQAYKNPNIDIGGIRFHSFSMKLWIDKQSFRLKKMEHHSKYEIPSKQKILTTIEQKSTLYISGEVKEIIIPDEVKNRL